MGKLKAVQNFFKDKKSYIVGGAVFVAWVAQFAGVIPVPLFNTLVQFAGPVFGGTVGAKIIRVLQERQG